MSIDCDVIFPGIVELASFDCDVIDKITSIDRDVIASANPTDCDVVFQNMCLAMSMTMITMFGFQPDIVAFQLILNVCISRTERVHAPRYYAPSIRAEPTSKRICSSSLNRISD